MTMQIKVPNSGGYGNPFERDPELVLADVLDELHDSRVRGTRLRRGDRPHDDVARRKCNRAPSRRPRYADHFQLTIYAHERTKSVGGPEHLRDA